MPDVIAALCRHGHYEQPEDVPSAHLPHPLTEKGRKQAKALAPELAELARGQGYRIHPVIDTSSLLRAHETAALAADGLSQILGTAFEVAQFDALAERCLGAAANLTVAQIEQVLERDPRLLSPPPGWKAMSEYKLPLPGAESLLEAGARVAGHLRTRTYGCEVEPSDKPWLKVFIGHGGAFRHAALALGQLSRDDIPRLSMHYARPVCLRAAPLPPWTLVAGAWKIRKGHQPAD